MKRILSTLFFVVLGFPMATGITFAATAPIGWFDRPSSTNDCNFSSTPGGEQGIMGWACQPGDWNQQLRVDIYADGPIGSGWNGGKLVGQPIASQSLADNASVASHCGGNTIGHRFLIAIPDQFRDGNPHTYQAYAIGYTNGNFTGNNPQIGSALTVTCPKPTVTTVPTVVPTSTGTCTSLGGVCSTSTTCEAGTLGKGSPFCASGQTCCKPNYLHAKLSIAAHITGIDRNNLQLNGDGSPSNGLTGIPDRTATLTFYTDTTTKTPVKTMTTNMHFNPDTDLFENKLVDVGLNPGTYYMTIWFKNSTVETMLNSNDPFTIATDGTVTTGAGGSNQSSTSGGTGTVTAIRIPNDPSKTPLLPNGDINGDNKIDTLDYNLWWNTYNLKCVNIPTSLDQSCKDAMSIPSSNIFYFDSTFGLYSDVNDDGAIDGIDFNIMRKNFPIYGFSVK